MTNRCHFFQYCDSHRTHHEGEEKRHVRAHYCLSRVWLWLRTIESMQGLCSVELHRLTLFPEFMSVLVIALYLYHTLPYLNVWKIKHAFIKTVCSEKSCTVWNTMNSSTNFNPYLVMFTPYEHTTFFGYITMAKVSHGVKKLQSHFISSLRN